MKNRNIYTLIGTAILFYGIILFSCSKKNDVKPTIQNVSSSESVFQVDITKDLTFFGGNYKLYTNNKSTPIIRIKLWRKSYNCLRKIGICRVQILPDEKNDNLFDEGREIDIPFATEITQEGLYIYFSQDVSVFSSEDLLLYVDENILLEDDLGALSDAHYIPAGVYEFSDLLGDYGGYHIPVY